MKIIRLTESDLTNIVKRVIRENDSMLEKNKRFLKNKLGIDFTNGIQQVTSTYDIPWIFHDFSSVLLNRYLNKYGPMYLFEYDGKKYLYQDRGDYESFISDDGSLYLDNEIPEMLGIDEMGLRFSNIIDLYFKEEDF